MARKTNTKTKTKTAAEDAYIAPKARKQKHTTYAEAIAEQAAEEGTTPEEVVEALVAPPAEAERPVRPAGTSNLAQTIRSHRRNYQVALHPNGKKTQNNGDTVAQALLLVPLDELKAFSAIRFEGKRYDHLNLGHARMCIGNNIRGAYRKGCPIVIEWLGGWIARAEAVLAEGEEAEAA